MRTAIGPTCARRSSGWPAPGDVIGARFVIGLLGLGLVLLPGRILADPTDEASKEQIDPEYVAGKAAIAIPCEEYEDLKKAVAEYRVRAGK